MSLAIHYRGKLDDRAVLPELLEAARLYCDQEGWHYREVDEPISGRVERRSESKIADHEMDEPADTKAVPIKDTLNGLIISPYPTCDPLWLTFNSEGELCFYLSLNDPDEYWEMKTLSTRTQSAPRDVHIALCNFLQVLQKDFFPGLSVFDEGGYFETNDASGLDDEWDADAATAEELEAPLEGLDPDDPSAQPIRQASHFMRRNGSSWSRRKNRKNDA